MSGPTSLQNYVSRLRKILGPGVLVRRGSGYELQIDPEQMDLTRFERLLARAREASSLGETASAATDLRQALALWRGPPLADVTFGSAGRGEVARLEERYASALEERIEADLALGSAPRPQRDRRRRGGGEHCASIDPVRRSNSTAAVRRRRSRSESDQPPR